MNVKLEEASFKPVKITLDSWQEVRALRSALIEFSDGYSGSDAETCKILLSMMKSAGVVLLEPEING